MSINFHFFLFFFLFVAHKVNTWLYFWPMYFSTFYLGDMYTLIFLSFNFAMELMTTVSISINFKIAVNVYDALAQGYVIAVLGIIW